MEKNKQYLYIDTDNKYIIALIKVFKTFLLEECAGYSHAELRLEKEISKCQFDLHKEREKIIKEMHQYLPIMGNIHVEEYTFKAKRQPLQMAKNTF